MIRGNGIPGFSWNERALGAKVRGTRPGRLQLSNARVDHPVAIRDDWLEAVLETRYVWLGRESSLFYASFFDPRGLVPRVKQFEQLGEASVTSTTRVRLSHG